MCRLCVVRSKHPEQTPCSYDPTAPLTGTIGLAGTTDRARKQNNPNL